MKISYTLSLVLIALLCTISSCKNDTVEDNYCEEVLYNEVFLAVHGERYCLPDGAELLINDLVNVFCPCNAICAWEGEMELNVTWTDSSGSSQTGNVSTHPTSVVLLENQVEDLDIIAEFDWTIEFEEECSESNGSPDILSAEIMIRN